MRDRHSSTPISPIFGNLTGSDALFGKRSGAELGGTLDAAPHAGLAQAGPVTQARFDPTGRWSRKCQAPDLRRCMVSVLSHAVIKLLLR
jgi:hypothetical protein